MLQLGHSSIRFLATFFWVYLVFKEACIDRYKGIYAIDPLNCHVNIINNTETRKQEQRKLAGIKLAMRLTLSGGK